MNNITRVNHIGIRVRDFDTSKAFYAKFGFEAITGPIGPEPVAIVEHPGGIVINFILNANDEDTRNILMDVPQKFAGYTHVALEVNDMDEMLASLDEEGIPLSGDLMEHPTGKSIFIRDPDRNVIEFVEPKRA